MVADDNLKIRVRVMDLITKLLEYVRDGKRDANDVSRVLQVVKDDPDFIQRLFPEIETSQPAAKPRRLKDMLRDWEGFYALVFGMEKDFSKLRIPNKKPGFDRLLVVAQGMTPEKIVSALKKRMTVWKYADDLDLDTVRSDRKTNQAYAIWARDRVEADEELENKSADDLKQEGIQGITLEERLLYELKYFLETGKHLDEKNLTLCAGSRYPSGDVPYVRWFSDDGEVGVGWYDLGSAGGLLHARSVISLN